MTSTTSLRPVLIAAPSVARAKTGQPLSLDVLVALRAPERVSTTKRPSLNLAVVIDISGSMNGLPLQHAKTAAAGLVHSLTEHDRVSVVVYGSNARVVLPSTPALQAKASIDVLLAGVQCEGMTALHAGWLTGAAQIAPFVSQYGVSRVLLLTDGCANVGETSVDALVAAGATLSDTGITTSSYGIGHNFNETLMTAIAQAGQGMAVYAADADGLATYFTNEFAMLGDLVGKDMRVELTITDAEGAPVVWTCLNPLATDSVGRIRLPALLSGTDSWAVFHADVPADKAHKNLNITARVAYVDEKGASHTSETTTPLVFGKTNAAANTEVVERAKEARAAQMARQAAEAAQRGDMGSMRSIVDQMAGMAMGNAYVASVAQNLSAAALSGDHRVFAKEALYSSTAMGTRSVDIGEDAGLLSAGKYGLRKAVQGQAVEGTKNDAGGTP